MGGEVIQDASLSGAWCSAAWRLGAEALRDMTENVMAMLICPRLCARGLQPLSLGRALRQKRLPCKDPLGSFPKQDR